MSRFFASFKTKGGEYIDKPSTVEGEKGNVLPIHTCYVQLATDELHAVPYCQGVALQMAHEAILTDPKRYLDTD